MSPKPTPIINEQAAADLLESIEVEIDDGYRAADYGSTGSSSGKPDSHPERQAIPPDKPLTGEQRARQAAGDRASETYQRTHALLAEIRSIEAAWWAERQDQRRIPGATPPRPGACHPHWDAGRDVKALKNHSRCSRCSDFHEKTGYDYPTIVLDIHAQIVAGLTADGMNRAKADIKAWDHPRVIRAWQATGWKAKVGDRYPERSAA